MKSAQIPPLGSKLKDRLVPTSWLFTTIPALTTGNFPGHACFGFLPMHFTQTVLIIMFTLPIPQRTGDWSIYWTTMVQLFGTINLALHIIVLKSLFSKCWHLSLDSTVKSRQDPLRYCQRSTSFYFRGIFRIRKTFTTPHWTYILAKADTRQLLIRALQNNY